ncbi:MAG: hypothetical protein Kow0096_15480 [Thiohalomonadaceae bacterium]
MTATTHSSTRATANWLIFRIGRVACAVPALSVASILPLPEHITAIPGADAGSPGLFHHGNTTVAIIDLRHRFGCETLDPHRGRLLLGQVGSGSYAFWVDSIIGLADAAQVRPAALPPELPHNVFSAALRYQDELVLCSDLAPLLAMRDAGGLRHLVCATPSPPAPAAFPAAAVAAARPPVPSPVATIAPAVTHESSRTARPLPPPAPARAPSRPATAPRPVPPRRSAPTVPSRPAVPPSPPAPAAPPPRPVPAAAPPAIAPRRHTPPPPMETVTYAAPPPAPVSTNRPWPLLLVLALLAVAIGHLLWPQAEKATPPAPPVARVTPAAPPAPEAGPLPVPSSEPTVAAAPPASPIFQGEGIQVEQNGEEITIVIGRPRPQAAPEPEPPAATGETEAAAAAAEAAPAPPAEAPQMYVHTVVKGDTLWAIAEHYLDDPWRYQELAQLSRIRNPDLIYPGNKVRIIIR